ncbi:MAG TPA: TlpA disulfide reductase family protein [Acidimicrobiales bacterium]|nr:TlpA disulfide reductase family protein [Acidimicrobiales bacterium]
MIIAAVVLAVALIAVVSVLTGAKVTPSGHGKALPTTKLVGEHVGNFSLGGLNGGEIHAPWTQGHASVLIFFASWCGPCQGEMPKVAAYIRAHNPSPIDVVGIDANDERSAGQAFVKKDGVTFPVAFDADGTVTGGDFGFQELPESVFINAKGVVKKVYFGAVPERVLASGIKMLKN